MRYAVRVEKVIAKRLGWRGVVFNDGWLAKNCGCLYAVNTLGNATRFDSRDKADAAAMMFAVENPQFIGKVAVREIVWRGDVMRTKEA